MDVGRASLISTLQLPISNFNCKLGTLSLDTRGNHPLGKIFLREEIKDDNWHDDHRGERHHQLHLGAALAHEKLLQANGEDAHVAVARDEQGPFEIVPRPDEIQERGRDDCRFAQRNNNREQVAQMPRAIHARRVEQIARNLHKELADEKNAKDARHKWHGQREVRVVPFQVEHHHDFGDERQIVRHHDRRENQKEDEIASRQIDMGKRIRRQDRGKHGAGDNRERGENAIREIANEQIIKVGAFHARPSEKLDAPAAQFRISAARLDRLRKIVPLQRFITQGKPGPKIVRGRAAVRFDGGHQHVHEWQD